MKNNLSRFFSLLLAVLTTMSVSATQPARRAAQARYNMAAAPSQSATADRKSVLERPHSRTKAQNSIFSVAAKASDINLNKPSKLRALAETNDMPDLLGSVIYSDNLDVAGYGLYTIPTNSSQDFNRLFRYANAEYGGVLVGDKYFTCENYAYPWGGSAIIYTGYDINTGRYNYEADGAYYTYSMTYDPTTSTVYAIANVDDNAVLTKVTFDTEQNRVLFDPVNIIETDEIGIWNAIACDSKGQLWAVYSDFLVSVDGSADPICVGSTLYKIDKNTATAKKIGETGYDSLYASDATFDLKTDRLYWTVLNTAMEGFITEINTSTGAATVKYAFPGNEEVTGLVILPPEAENGAPAAVTDVTSGFTGGSLSGTIDFKAPTTLYDGSAASGDITYTVTANGIQAATGTTTFGADVAAQVTVPAAGFYKFAVTVSNEVGESPAVETEAYIGFDTPEATSVTASYANGMMTVKWLPVTTSINGGYLDVNAVTYNVTRFPDKKLVANGISETTFTDDLPEPASLTTYYYRVVAKADGLSSEAAQSNYVTLGSVIPPYTATFENDMLDGFKVVDANGDGTTWVSSDGLARIAFNKTLDMDDWLISPAVSLTGGKLYDIAAQFACGNPQYKERVEVKVGRTDNPGDMTIVLLDPTVIDQNTDAPLNWTNVFIPDTDGKYYFGIHGISDMDKFLLFVDNFTVSEPKETNCPAAVTGLTVTPGANGALTATVDFVTPDKALNGDKLIDLTRIELMRDGELIKTWTAPAVNTALSYTDNLSALGEYTYTVVAYNAIGNGPEAVVTAYIGIDYPAAVFGVNAVATDKPGEVTVTWDPVTTTAEDMPIDPSLVKYQVFRIMGGLPISVSDILDATSFTYQAVAADSQAFAQFAVAAVTDRGFGKILNSSLTANIPLGKPYNGLTLTNDDDINRYILGINSVGGGAWSVYDDTLIPSQDDDNRMLAMYGPFENCYGDLYTGLVSLEGIANPGLSFYTYNIGSTDGGSADINELTVGVKENGAAEFVDLKTIVISETGPENCWNRVVIDLSDYAGKTIQINFYSIVKAIQYTIIDNIRIGTIYTDDLSVRSLRAPEHVTCGNSYTVAATVSNDGTATADNYTVELYADDKLVDSKAGRPLAGGITAVYDFDLVMSPLATDVIDLTVKVVMTGDENTANNTTSSISVFPVRSTLPAVRDLTGTKTDTDVRLTWSEPDLDAIPADAITDDFEDGLSYASRYGEWTFVDMDGSPVDGFSDIQIPNIIEGVTKGSFWIWDTNTIGAGNRYFEAHSGSKYLFALYRADTGMSDEWAISPKLNGSAQTISFYAKSYSSQYPEKISIGYSTGSTDPDDFIMIETINRVASDWTLYEFELPEGAMHFAINSCARNSFMLMVDDVTYIPDGAFVTTDFEGYDVYRNGQKLNRNLLTTREYTDTDVIDGKTYEYVVVAVYNKGQSAPSDVEVIHFGSVDSIHGDAISITSGKDSIIVTGAAGLPVSVHAVDGMTIYAGQGEARTVIPVQQGVYVVKAGQTVTKIIVR